MLIEVCGVCEVLHLRATSAAGHAADASLPCRMRRDISASAAGAAAARTAAAASTAACRLRI